MLFGSARFFLALVLSFGVFQSGTTFQLSPPDEKFPLGPSKSTNLAMTSSSSEPNETLRVLGVCGGIGSGKSSASKLLVSELGCVIHLDADKMGHEVYSPGSQAVRDIASEFGEGVLQENGQEIDRKKLGAIVFAERSEMAKLERIVWPHMQVLIAERIESVRTSWKEGKIEAKVPVIVLEAAVLLEGDFKELVDGIWVVTAPREVALERLMETRGLSKEEAEKRINAQESRRDIGNLQEEVDNGVVTGVIQNDGSLEDLTAALQTALNNPQSWKQ